ncbi:MAG: LysR family transcriptional regulator [Deltaproteobacteria bacterium]|nr:LysR family transcriptional regulator [Deltaproteobacteria bacterium]
MRLAGIDLNLLTSLDAVLETQNLTVAAKRLGLTQPAVSHALKRLRELLGDPLLVRTKRGMQPTPRALELRPAVRVALAAAAAVLQAAPAFDPAVSQRTFAISLPDQAAFQILPALANLLVDAPGIRIDVRPAQNDRTTEALASDLDLAIGVYRDAPAGVRDDVLWKEDFACVVRRGSPAARGPWDLARYLSLRHLLIAPRGVPGSPLDDQLARKGHTRTIAMMVPHFLVAPHVVAATDLVWTAPARLAKAFAEQIPLTIRDVPFALEGFTITMRWHVRLDRDPGLAWLRETLRSIAP